MKYLPIFNKGDKVTVNNKYIGLKSMVGEIYTIRAGPARCSDTWCYWLENVAGGIAADALEPLEQTNEEWLHSLNTEEKAKWLSRNSKFMYGCGRMETTPKIMYEEDWECWLKEIHE